MDFEDYVIHCLKLGSLIFIVGMLFLMLITFYKFIPVG